MDDYVRIAVSPRHSVRLAQEYAVLVQKPQRRDFVVRTIAKREANGNPLMSAEIVIAGAETRERFPLAVEYALHFRKTYFPGRLHGDPKHEFDRQADAHRVIAAPPPIGWGEREFRTCLLPGMPYSALSPFRAEPFEANIRHTRDVPIASAAGLYRLAEEAFAKLRALQNGGIAHGDAELHNFVVCPAPLEIVPIDFEGAFTKDSMSEEEWTNRSNIDLVPLLRHAVLLECCLGEQSGPLAEAAHERMDELFKEPDRFRREIERRADLGG
jgi:hypothetical protein